MTIGDLLSFGFSFLLTWHILRYSKENNIEIPKIIKTLKDAGIPVEDASYISFGGYNSFKNMINLCQGLPIETTQNKKKLSS